MQNVRGSRHGGPHFAPSAEVNQHDVDFASDGFEYSIGWLLIELSEPYLLA
jgi:hypothetical protein